MGWPTEQENNKNMNLSSLLVHSSQDETFTEKQKQFDVAYGMHYIVGAFADCTALQVNNTK